MIGVQFWICTTVQEYQTLITLMNMKFVFIMTLVSWQRLKILKNVVKKRRYAHCYDYPRADPGKPS